MNRSQFRYNSCIFSLLSRGCRRGGEPSPVHHNRTPNISEKIFNVLWQLKKDSYAEETIKGYSKRLRHLEQKADLDKPELVKAFISQKFS